MCVDEKGAGTHSCLCSSILPRCGSYSGALGEMVMGMCRGYLKTVEKT